MNPRMPTPRASDTIRTMLSRVASLFRLRKLDRDLDEELRTHIDLAIAENMAHGMNRQQARTAALRSFGGIPQTAEKYRLQRGLPWMETLAQDTRYALRRLARSPGFAAAAIFTLALSIGAVTSVFSVVNGVLLAPYAFRDPGRIVVWRETVRELVQAGPLLPNNYRHYLNLKAHATTIEDAAILYNPVFSISADSGAGPGVSDSLTHPQVSEGLAVSPNFFSVLGVTPLLGRTFTPEEAQTGKDKVLLLTWGAWQKLFQGDPAVLGRTLRVGGIPQTIVGVLPRSFRFPVVSMMPGQVTGGSTDRYELFKPMAPTQEDLTVNDGDYNYLVVARLKAGVSIQQAQSELDGIEKSTAAADHLTSHPGVVVQPFAQEITGDLRKPLWLLLAAVSGVLLMACVNLANLQIARGVAREHETALCSALGAGRSRLLQSVLVENLILGVAGGLMGILLALTGEKLLLLAAASLPRINEVHLSLPMLAVALALSISASLAFGMLPAFRSLHVLPQSALQSASTRVSGNRQAAKFRRLLVAVEVACSVALLIVTALIARSFSHILSQDRQFNAQHVVLARADLIAPRYSSGDALPDNFGYDPGSLERGRMIDRTLDRLRSLPGVQSAAMLNVLPLSGDMSEDRMIRPDHPVPPAEEPIADRRFISTGYFATMQIPLLSGRDFTAQDQINHDRINPARNNQHIAILSQKAATAAFPNENPLGRTMLHWGQVYTIVGIVADARTNDLKRNVPIYYLPSWDFPPYSPVFLVRTAAGNAQGIETPGPAIRDAIWKIDPDVSIPTVVSLNGQIDESVATERFQAIILSSFGAAALLIAVLGIYGVLTYSVSLRTQEIGIRIALGSNKSNLVRLVLSDISWPVLGGIIFGLMGAAITAKWIGSLLYQTSTVDPLAILLGLATLLTAALLAALLPLRRAVSVDPILALRSE